jgi:hypothetical protein
MMLLAAFIIAAPALGASLYWLDKAIAERRQQRGETSPPPQG